MSIFRLFIALVNIGNGASLSKEATLSGRLFERTRRRDCVKMESMNAEGTCVVWRNVERLVLDDPRSLEFREFIDTSSVLMDVAQLRTAFSLVVDPGFAIVEFAH